MTDREPVFTTLYKVTATGETYTEQHKALRMARIHRCEVETIQGEDIYPWPL